MRTVLHYKYGSYLPITENWIFNQIKYLKKYKSIVYAHKKENINIFSLNSNIIKTLNTNKFSLLFNKYFQLNLKI